MKRYSTLLFSVKEKSLETRKLRKLLAKEEEEEVQEDVQRDSKVVKEYMKKLCKSCPSNASQSLAFIDSSCLVKKTIGRVINLRKSCQKVHLLTFYSKLVTGYRLP